MRCSSVVYLGELVEWIVLKISDVAISVILLSTNIQMQISSLGQGGNSGMR